MTAPDIVRSIESINDGIVRLKAENARLRSALVKIAEKDQFYTTAKIAREALAPAKPEEKS